MKLLDPGELASGEQPAGDRVEMADELIAQRDRAVGPVGGVRNHLGPAQVGEVEREMERGVAEDLGHRDGRRGKLVLGPEPHGVSLLPGWVRCHRRRRGAPTPEPPGPRDREQRTSHSAVSPTIVNTTRGRGLSHPTSNTAATTTPAASSGRAWRRIASNARRRS